MGTLCLPTQCPPFPRGKRDKQKRLCAPLRLFLPPEKNPHQEMFALKPPSTNLCWRSFEKFRLDVENVAWFGEKESHRYARGELFVLKACSFVSQVNICSKGKGRKCGICDVNPSSARAKTLSLSVYTEVCVIFNGKYRGCINSARNYTCGHKSSLNITCRTFLSFAYRIDALEQ